MKQNQAACQLLENAIPVLCLQVLFEADTRINHLPHNDFAGQLTIKSDLDTYSWIRTPYVISYLNHFMIVGREQQFHISLIKGQIGKEIARALLEKSGYEAYSFGYESLLSQMRYDVKKRRVPLTDSNNRLRSTPDLLVYDDNKNETYFVEIKFSRPNDKMKVRLRLRPLQWYKKYWNDSILILVAPARHVFYARRVSQLEIPEADYQSFWFDVDKQFLPIENLFPRVSMEIMKQFYTVLERFSEIEKLEAEEEGAENGDT